MWERLHDLLTNAEILSYVILQSYYRSVIYILV